VSDNYLILIPDSPAYVPSRDAQERALALFREFTVNADETRAEEFPSIRFIDCGANFETVTCPDCRQELSQEWFGRVMDESYKDGFQLFPIVFPCCSTRRRLDELVFEWPQGFARFRLEARNPGIGELPEEVMSRLEQILGCKLLLILRHL
jgi:hypothetical protein